MMLPSNSEELSGIGSRSQERAVTIANSLRYRFAQSLLALLAICFVVQAFSPLRLNPDAIALLSVGESVAHGRGFFDYGKMTVFPPGYPALLAVLLRTGLAHPWVIVGLNVVFLSAGLLATYALLIHDFFEDKATVLLICSFFLLSFVVIKHVTLPLTDVPFFACSMCCLALMNQSTKSDSHLPLTDVPFFACSMCCLALMNQSTKSDSHWRFVILAVTAWLLALAAIAVRRIGVALVPPLVFMIVCSPQFKSLLKRSFISITLVIILVIVFVGAGTTQVIGKASTLSDFIKVAGNSRVSALILQTLSYRFTELGELFDNFPISMTPTKLLVMVPWAGGVLFLLTLFGFATKRRAIGPTEVFLVCYMGILFAWPFQDPRFWLPVVPLLIAYSILAVSNPRFPKSVVTIYGIIFATFGFFAIAYSTRISFAGSRFPDRYLDGRMKSTYCAAIQSCRDGADSNKVDAKALRLLREYK